MRTVAAIRGMAGAARRGAPLAALAVILALLALGSEGDPARASHLPGSISLLYIDMDTTGNTIDAPTDSDADTVADTEATSLGPIEECAQISGTGTLDIDIAIADWPANGDQLVGYDITLGYDPAVVKVAAVNYGGAPLSALISADPQSAGIANLGDSVPDNDGALVMSVMDVAGPFDADEDLDGEEVSAGFLARITLQGVAMGQSTLTLTTPGALVLTEDALGSDVIVDQVNNGFVSVDQACVPGSQPGPTPPPLPPSFCSGGADSDGDGFEDCIETFVGTNPAKNCAATGTANDEDPPDLWPGDANDDQVVDILDFLTLMLSHLSAYDARSDLNTDSAANMLDALPLKTHFAEVCTPAASASIVVDSIGDADARDTVITLREAILLATGVLAVGTLDGGEADNVTGTPGAASPDTITFDPVAFPSGTPSTITLTSALPDLSTDIDTVDGSGAGVIVDGGIGSIDCFTISSNANTIAGLNLITDCPTAISITGASNTIGGTNIDNDGDTLYNEDPLDSVDNDGDTFVDEDPLEGGMVIGPDVVGVKISGAAATGNTVLGNQIGAYLPGNDNGVRIQAGAQNNTVGGTTAGERNVISGNNGGVFITGSGTDGNRVKGNYIGTDVAGSDPPATQPGGVRIQAGAKFNTIGGATTPGTCDTDCNVISGNHNAGVVVTGTGTTDNTVSANYIGTDAAGTAAIAGNGIGVQLGDGAQTNTIGGMTAAERNVISGNNAEGGVRIRDAGTSGNTVSGNYIGTNFDGSGAIANGIGVLIDFGASGNTVGGATVGEGNVISGNSQQGVLINGTGTNSNTVSGNYIGTNAAGASPLPNLWGGVTIWSDASSNTVGGPTAGERNVISGNGVGVSIGTEGTSGNVVEGNYVGLNAAGTAALGGTNGVVIVDGADNNTVRGNVISGHSANGVVVGLFLYLLSGDVTGALSFSLDGHLQAVVNGQSVLEVDGNGVVSNQWVWPALGQDLELHASTTGACGSIGPLWLFHSGTGEAFQLTAGADNGCAGPGEFWSTTYTVAIPVSPYGPASGNIIQGNLIGTNPAGDSPIPNDSGVAVAYQAGGTRIGGSTAAERNIISGNSQGGVGLSALLAPVPSMADNRVTGNYIGTNAAGDGPVANGTGVVIKEGAEGSIVGGTAAGEGNIIASNTENGICVVDDTSTGNTIRGNSIHSNGLLGIDLAPTGQTCSSGTVTANDAGDGDPGPNNLMNFPVITGVTYDGLFTTVTGTLDTVPPIETATVDVYASDVADGSGNGEGRAYVGSTMPDALGAWTLIVSGFPTYPIFTATATSANPSTSEFSAAYTPSVGPRLPATAVAWESLGAPGPVNGNFVTFGSSRVPNTTGEMAFWASVTGGTTTEGIFKYHPVSGLSTLVALNDPPPPAIGGTFTALGQAPIMNENGDVVFWASMTGGLAPEAILLYSGGLLSVVAAVNSPATGADTFTSFSDVFGPAIPIINNNGDIVFWGKTDAGQGIYKYSGGLSAVALTGDGAPGTGPGTFSGFVAFGGWPTVPVITANGQVTFWGAVSGGTSSQGIFLDSAGLLTDVVLEGQGTPEGGTYSFFAQIASVNNSGEVAFWAAISGISAPTCPTYGDPCAVFKKPAGDPVSTVIASGDTGPSGVAGTVVRPGTVPLLNDSGQITVWADITNGFAEEVLIRFTGGVMENVAAIGNDTPIGGTFSPDFMSGGVPSIPASNNLGQVAYWGKVSGGSGSEGIFLTTTTGTQTQVAALSGQPAPGTGGGTFDPNFDLDINSGGEAVFRDTVSTGSTSGIFRFFAGSAVEEVAVEGNPAPTGGDFTGFGPPVNNDTYVVATATTTAGDGLFRFFAGSPATLALKDDTAPDLPTRFFAGFADPSINNVDDVIAVVALDPTGGGGQALYRFFAGSPGTTPELLAATGDTAPDISPTRFFAGFAQPSVSDGGVVTARVTLDDTTQAVYRFFAGTAVLVAHQGDQAPDVSPASDFAGFGERPAINLTGDVTYQATLDDGRQGAFRFFAGSSTTHLLALQGDSVPTGVGGDFGVFGDPAINVHGQVVVRAGISTGSASEGLFLFFMETSTSPVETTEIVLQGQTTPDGAETYGGVSPVFPFIAYSDTAKIVYVANLVGGSQGVYIASLDTDGDGVLDFLDNCATTFNTAQINTDRAMEATYPGLLGDDLGNACDDDKDGDAMDDGVDPCPINPDCDGDGIADNVDTDDDNDLISDTAENNCGSNFFDPASIPERIDGPFLGLDDDGNDGADEPLPPGAQDYDCDGDGYTGTAEDNVYSYVPQITGDQKACQEYDTAFPDPAQNAEPSLRWPADLSNAGPPLDSINKITIMDITSFMAPVRYLDTNLTTSPGDVRWDLMPGKGIFLFDINVQDLTSLISLAPSMLDGASALNGPPCPWPP